VIESGQEFYIGLTELRALWDSMLLKRSANVAIAREQEWVVC